MKTALFVKTKNLGDAVILTASIVALRDRYRIHVLCFSDCAEIYQDLAGVERVWSVNRGERGWASVFSGLRLLRGLRKFHFDLMAQFSDDWRGALLARLLCVRLSVAHKRNNRIGLWLRSFTALAPMTPRRHAAEQDLDLLRRVGLHQGEAPGYDLPQSHRVNARAEQMLAMFNFEKGEYVVLHLFSRWTFKQLSANTCRQLICRLAADGHKVLVTGDRRDAVKFQDLSLEASPNVQMAFSESIATFSSLVNYSRALLSIDSLSLHLASALTKPVLAVFGPSGEDNWRPWHTSHAILEKRDEYPCRPCGKDGCGGSKVSQCLATIDADAVAGHFYRLIGK